MSQKQNQAPLVQFAQKATAIVKAAGFDPKTIDLESFRRLAPIIFTRAYSAIYKEQLLADINEYTNREEQILNSQLVIDGLTAKTRNPALATISGIDIFQGSHRAVGILAGVLFAEGQRLWMEKMKSGGDSSPSKTGNKEISPVKPDSEAEDIDNEEERKQLEMIKNSSNVPPHELEKLLHRIAYLENRLKKRMKRRPRSRSRSKSPMNRRADSPNSRSRSPDSRMRPRSQQRKRHALNGDDNDNSNNPTSDISEDEEESLDDNGSEPPILRPKSRSQNRRIRPSSAPHHRSRRVKGVSHRLYNAPLNKQAIELAHQQQQQQAPPKHPRPLSANPLFTYDLKSGRRILVSQAEHERELREQAKKAMGNLNHVTKDEDDFMAGGSSNNHIHTHNKASMAPDYPCKRIEASVEEWVKKNRQVAGVDKPVIETPQPRQLNIYQYMDRLDIVFTIEHCHNCEHHQITTRHKPEEYKKHADEFLRILTQSAMQAGFCVRVGVARFEADITCKSRTTDENSRIGAFEIQIAVKNDRGELSLGMLHSKLFSGRWPSKSVLEKRFHTFMAKFPNLATYSYSADGVTDYHMEISSDGQNYPIGRCTFDDTVMGDPFWSFTSFQVSSSASVMWTFDTRGLQHLPKFSLQAMVLVNNVTYQPGCVEKYPLIGVVKRYEDTASHNTGHKRYLYVQLKYHKADTRVLESDCIAFDDLHPSLTKNLAGEAGKLPLDLEGLLMIARRDNLLEWQISDEEDRLVDNGRSMELSKRSLYHQLRKLAWKLVTKHAPQPLLHPVMNRILDVPLCYSEKMMTKLQDIFGLVVNTQQLEKYLPVDPKAAVAATVKTAAVTSTATNGINTKRNISSSNNNNDTSSANNAITTSASPRVSPRVSPRSLTTSTAITPGAAQDFAALAAAAAAATNDSNANESDLQESSSAAEVGISTVAQIRKTRRPTVSSKPSIQSLHELDDRFHSLITLPSNKKSDKTPIEAFLMDVEAIVAEYPVTSEPPSSPISSMKVVKLEDIIRLLYDYGLDSIADSAQDMRVLASYLSPIENDDGMSSELHVGKLFEWLRGQFLYPTEHNEQLVVTPPPSSTTNNDNGTNNSNNNDSKTPSPSKVQPQSKALLQLLGGVATPLSSRRPTVNLASIPETPNNATSKDNPDGEEDEEKDEVEEKQKQQKDDVNKNENQASESTSNANVMSDDTNKDKNNSEQTSEQPPPSIVEPSSTTSTEASSDNTNGEMKSNNNNNTFVIVRSPRETVLSPSVHQNKDIVISSIVLEGVALQHSAYDSAYLMFEIDNGVHLDATVCLAREKGSKQRTFNVTGPEWTDIPFSAMQFEQQHVYLSVVVAENNALTQQYPTLPTVTSTILGTSSNSIAIPCSVFEQPAFTISATVQIPVMPNTVIAGSSSGAATPSSAALAAASAAANAAASGTNNNGNNSTSTIDEGKVTITLHGLSREGKAARMTRILSMKPVELLNLKFEPVAFDDYDDNSDFESDSESAPSKKSLSKHHPYKPDKHQSSHEGLEFLNDESLNQTLFPQASYHNLLSPVKGLSANPSTNTLPPTTEES